MADVAPPVDQRCSATGGADCPVAVVVVAGDVDLLTYPDLDHALRRAIRQPHTEMILADLRAVAFMSVAGIRTLAHAQETASDFEKPFLLIAVTAPLRRLLRICAGEHFFRLHDTLEAAVASTMWMRSETHHGGQHHNS